MDEIVVYNNKALLNLFFDTRRKEEKEGKRAKGIEKIIYASLNAEAYASAVTVATTQ